MANIVSPPQDSSVVESSLSEKTRQKASKWHDDRAHWARRYPALAETIAGAGHYADDYGIIRTSAPHPVGLRPPWVKHHSTG